jgi:DnaK suppressor protein
MLDQETIKQLGNKLLTRRKELLDRLQLKAEAWEALQERQIEYEERASNETLSVPMEELDEKSFGELSRIDKALRKIKQQRYGICELCGQVISKKRLQSMPDAERCLNCASQNVSMFGGGPEDIEESPEEA